MSKDKFNLDNFDLSDVVGHLLDGTRGFDGERSSIRNLIDPFAAALESALNGYETESQWLEAEHQRTRQKALMNHVGNLQQSIIGKLEGWTSYPAGTNRPDVVGRRDSQLLLFEVKNKHNTMNARSSEATYDLLVNFLSRKEFQGYTAGVVAIIAPVRQGSYFKPFAPSGNPQRKDIVFMPGRVFYAFATDAQNRMPYKNVQPSDPIHTWESWHTIDLIVAEFWNEIQKQTKYVVPKWIKDLTNQALGI